ncbi:MAG: hypothetical protein AAFY03_06855, partial [Pseudomonadota bacterium]
VAAKELVVIVVAKNDIVERTLAGIVRIVVPGVVDNVIFGNNDDDELFGGDGKDLLIGGAGHDWLMGDMHDLLEEFSLPSDIEDIKIMWFLDEFADKFEREDFVRDVAPGLRLEDKLETFVASIPAKVDCPIVVQVTAQDRPDFPDTQNDVFEDKGDFGLVKVGYVPTTADIITQLAQHDAEAILAAARDVWVASGVVSEAGLDFLDNLTVEIADLPFDGIGAVTADKIIVDGDAAGRGWFVDLTPYEDEEFFRDIKGDLDAVRTGPADGRIDLLSVMIHEVGSALRINQVPDQLQPGMRFDPPTQVFSETAGAFVDANDARSFDAARAMGLNIGTDEDQITPLFDGFGEGASGSSGGDAPSGTKALVAWGSKNGFLNKLTGLFGGH